MAKQTKTAIQDKVNTKLRKGDQIVVISGKYKGKRGKIMELDKQLNKALVEGVNLVKKTMKKTQENPKGGIMEKEAYLSISNLMYWDSASGKGVRLGYRKTQQGKKERFLRNKSQKAVG